VPRLRAALLRQDIHKGLRIRARRTSIRLPDKLRDSRLTSSHTSSLMAIRRRLPAHRLPASIRLPRQDSIRLKVLHTDSSLLRMPRTVNSPLPMRHMGNNLLRPVSTVHSLRMASRQRPMGHRRRRVIRYDCSQFCIQL
jgi:hypothetical protein